MSRLAVRLLTCQCTTMSSNVLSRDNQGEKARHATVNPQPIQSNKIML